VNDPSQLPFLIKLFDDDSEQVRATVLSKLLGWGEDLGAALGKLEPAIDIQRLTELTNALDAYKKKGDQERRVTFQPGQLVTHRRYGYRGVVVDLTEECAADDDWYLKNQTQPTRDQPWYHVLVHGSIHVTYAAHSSLEEDDSMDSIVHPWISVFFEAFIDGVYKRNDRPFPG
jgi:heat shock protein HspQ